MIKKMLSFILFAASLFAAQAQSLEKNNIVISQNSEGQWGVIRGNNEVVLPFRYKEIRSVGDYFFATKIIDDDSLAYTEMMGYEIYDRNLKPVPLSIGIFSAVTDTVHVDKDGVKSPSDSDTLVIALQNMQFGLLNLKAPWHWAIPPIYDYLYRFDNTPGLLIAEKRNDSYGIIDFKGNTIVPFEYSALRPINEEKQLCIASKDSYRIENRVYGIIDLKNQTLLPFKYNQIDPVENQPKWYYVHTKQGDSLLCGVTDISGKTILPEKYADVCCYSDNIFIYLYDRKIGFVSDKGKEITSPLYKRVRPFNAGYAFVKTEDYYGVIDTQGKLVMKTPFPNETQNKDINMSSEYGKERTYSIAGKKYNYKGELLEDVDE